MNITYFAVMKYVDVIYVCVTVHACFCACLRACVQLKKTYVIF